MNRNELNQELMTISLQVFDEEVVGLVSENDKES